MKRSQLIVAIISIIVIAILWIFLSNHPDLIKVMVNEYEILLTPVQKIIKNSAISMFCGLAIYAVFYEIPAEYKKANQK